MGRGVRSGGGEWGGGAFQPITLRQRASVAATTVEPRADDQYDGARWSGRR